MKNKNNIVFIFITLAISILIAFTVELFFFNRKVLSSNKIEQAKIVETNGIIEEGDYYKTVSKDAYIVIENSSNYINKLQFDYKVKDSFNWNVETSNKENITNVSSNLISKTIKSIDRESNILKVKFNQKNIRFKNIEINNKIYINYSRILFIIVLITILVLLIRYRVYFYKHLEKGFLLIAIPVGTLFILTAPKGVFVCWDDQIHLKNMYTLMQSSNVKYSDALKSISSQETINDRIFTTREEKRLVYKKLNKLHYQTKDKKTPTNNYSSRYNKLIYIPYYVGFKLGETIHLDFVLCFVLSKLFNLAVYISIMYFAILLSKNIKKVVFVISLLISNMFFATQFSCDSLITASLVLAVVLFMKMLEDKKVNYKYLIAFVLAVIWASLPKAVYCPVLLLLLFIPNKRFENNKKANLVKIMIIIITLLLMSTFILPVLMHSSAISDLRGGNTNTGQQLMNIMHNPVNYCLLVIKYFISVGPILVIGQDTLINLAYAKDGFSLCSQFAYYTSLILLLYVTINEKEDKKIVTNPTKIIYGVMYIGLFLLIVTALYLSYTPVGLNTVRGVQPRYFIPLLLPLMIILKPTKNNIKNANNGVNILLLIIPFIVLMMVAYTFVFRSIGI